MTMALRDWVGYPGMLEDQNMERLASMTLALAGHVEALTKAVINLQDHVVAIEGILRQQGLAK